MSVSVRVGAIAAIAVVVAAAYATVESSTALKGSKGSSAVSVPENLVTSGAARELDAQGQERDMPRFTSDGSLIRPEGWEEWVMVGASIGLTYSESGPAPVAGAGPGMFHTIFMQPWAYRHYQGTGEFAEKTMFILAMSQAAQTADPARGGFFEGERMLAEIHLKQKGLHESGWGFYAFGGGAESAPMIPGDAACYSCHAEETTLDNVFVQFYPPLRRAKEGR